MINLRDQLKEILPEILPRNPSEAIKGTELIRLVKYRLQQTYSDATLRYHFSIMCCDPSSPIAKVEQGQGYYLRAAPLNSINSARTMRSGEGLFESSAQAVDLAISRANKFKAIFFRETENDGRFPFSFEASFKNGSPYENLWKIPDAAVIDWEVGEIKDEGISLDQAAIDLKKSLGLPPFYVSSHKLKIETTYETFCEDLYQTLSNSRWAHGGELVIACAINDEQLVEELRKIGAEHGIGITSFGMGLDVLDDLPDAREIARLPTRGFEAIQSRLHKHRITGVARRTSPDWQTIEKFRLENNDFRQLFRWAQRCLGDGQAHGYEAFCKLIAEGESSDT